MIENPAVVAMVRHHAAVYRDLADPVGLLRGGRGELASYWAYAGAGAPGGLGGEQVAAYSELMAASQPLVAAEVLDAYDVRRHRVLMDVGGGTDGFWWRRGRGHRGWGCGCLTCLRWLSGRGGDLRRLGWRGGRRWWGGMRFTSRCRGGRIW